MAGGLRCRNDLFVLMGVSTPEVLEATTSIMTMDGSIVRGRSAVEDNFDIDAFSLLQLVESEDYLWKGDSFSFTRERKALTVSL